MPPLSTGQNSSGGKTKLGGITKRGDVYLRTLLIQGAKSAVMTAHKRKDPISLRIPFDMNTKSSDVLARRYLCQKHRIRSEEFTHEHLLGGVICG